MDIVRFKGGLGNQMFQYAFYLSLKEKGKNISCDLGYYEDGGDGNPFVLDTVFPKVELIRCKKEEYEYLNQKYKKACKSHIGCYLNSHFKNFRSVWMENGAGCYDEAVYSAKNCIFNGYWQTEKYFKDIEEKVRESFEFSYGEDKLKELGEEFGGKNTVAVHVRRGDYLLEMNAKIFGGICTLDYYQRAVDRMKEKVPGALFVVFSNDLQWVKDHLKLENAVYVSNDLFDTYQDWYDMYLMSRCRNNIIANSSFSWWGAWLNANEEKTVIAPERWLNESDTVDLWPDGWIKL